MKTIDIISDNNRKYILGYEILNMYKDIPYIFFMESKRSSKKFFGNMGDKTDRSSLLRHGSNVALVFKIYGAFKDFFSKYDTIAFSINRDGYCKRSSVYYLALKRMGFKHFYKKSGAHFASKNKISRQDKVKINEYVSNYTWC